MRKEGEFLKNWAENVKKIQVSEIAEAFGKTSKTPIYELFKKDVLPIPYVKMFHYILELPLEKLYEGDEGKIQQVLNSRSRNNYVKFKCSSPRKDNAYKQTLLDYYDRNKDTTVEYFEKANDKIFVVGYYPAWEKKYGSSIAYSAFEEKQTQYFEGIQKVLKSKGKEFKYSRCEQIKKPIEGVGILSKKDLAGYAIKYMSKASLQHVCWCLENLDEMFDLYVVNEPYRYYTFCLIDEDFILAEYARFNKNGSFIPDTHLICRNKYDLDDTAEVSNFIALHKQHIEHLEAKHERYIITKLDMIHALDDLENEFSGEDLSSKYAIRNEWIDKINGVLNSDLLKQIAPKELDISFLKKELIELDRETEKVLIGKKESLKTKKIILSKRINLVRMAFGLKERKF